MMMIDSGYFFGATL